MRHLYRVLIPPAHVLLLTVQAFLCVCRFFESRSHFRSGLVLENKCRSSLSITAAVERPRVVL